MRRPRPKSIFPTRCEEEGRSVRGAEQGKGWRDRRTVEADCGRDPIGSEAGNAEEEMFYALEEGLISREEERGRVSGWRGTLARIQGHDSPTVLPALSSPRMMM